MKIMLAILLALSSVTALAGCTGSEAEITPEAAAPDGGAPAVGATQVITPVLAPTVVERAAPPPTSTIDPAKEPLAAVEVEGIPGIVAPAAAVLVDMVPSTADEAARADFTIEGFEVEDVDAWFREQLADLGWELEEESEGALVFVHAEELSGTFAEEGLKRGLSLFFGTVDDAAPDAVSFTIVVEPAERSESR